MAGKDPTDLFISTQPFVTEAMSGFYSKQSAWRYIDMGTRRDVASILRLRVTRVTVARDLDKRSTKLSCREWTQMEQMLVAREYPVMHACLQEKRWTTRVQKSHIQFSPS